MLRAVISCFDDFVVGTDSVHTSSEFDDPLGAFDRLVFQAIVDQVTGSSLRITAAIEVSNDRRNWVQKNGTAEVNEQSLTASDTNVFVGSDNGETPSLAYVRLRVRLSGTAPAAHVKLVACLRDDG